MWRSVSRDSLIFFASACALVVFQFGYRYLSIDALSVANYGRVALLLSIFNGATVIGLYGIPATVSRLAARTNGHARDLGLLRAASIATIGPCALATIVMAGATYVVTRSSLDSLVAAVGVPPMIWAVLYSGFIRGKGLIWPAAAIQPANVVVQTVALLVMMAFGAKLSVGWVLASFYIGNFGAYGAAVLYRRLALRRAIQTNDELDPEATSRRILSFSMWLALANLAVLMLTIVPRIALAHSSYREVALFDLALLVYTIPQRLRSSFLIALLPVASVERKRGARITVPGNVDLALVAVAFLALDGLLWATHMLRFIFVHIGMGSYTGAEPLLLIILLAGPAELFFGLNSGLLQAYGQSRRLCAVSVGVLCVSAALSLLTVSLGTWYLACVLAGAYWLLHFLTRRMLVHSEVQETSILLPALIARWRGWRYGASTPAVTGAETDSA
jgi:O-antigen/teichoic acid export membrane protein